MEEKRAKGKKDKSGRFKTFIYIRVISVYVRKENRCLDLFRYLRSRIERGGENSVYFTIVVYVYFSAYAQVWCRRSGTLRGV